MLEGGAQGELRGHREVERGKARRHKFMISREKRPACQPTHHFMDDIIMDDIIMDDILYMLGMETLLRPIYRKTFN
jgi:hypothetical protein